MSGKYCIQINLERIKTISYPQENKKGSLTVFQPQKPTQPSEDAIIVQQRLQALSHPPREENKALRTHHRRTQRHHFNLRRILGSKRRKLHSKKRRDLRHHRRERQRQKHFIKDHCRRTHPRLRLCQSERQDCSLPGTWRWLQPGTNSRGQCAALRRDHGDVEKGDGG